MASFPSSFLFSMFSCLLALASSSDTSILLEKIKPALLGSSSSQTNIQLSSWNTSLPLCRWRGLQWSFPNGSLIPCAKNSSYFSNFTLYKDQSLQIVSIHLPASALNGFVPKEIGELSSLESLLIEANSLTGTIPLELGNSPLLSELDLSQNQINGSLPVSIWNLCNQLTSISSHGNQLSGSIPTPAAINPSCENLKVLDFGGNRLVGEFPEFVTSFSNLQELDLSSNNLSGAVPDSIIKLNHLERLNLSYNNFSGVLPQSLSNNRFTADVFMGNNVNLCGLPLRQCGSGSGLSAGVIAGIVIGLMAGVVVLASVLIGWHQGRKRKNVGRRIDEEEMEMEEENGGEGKLMVFQGMDLASCLPIVRHIGRSRHENLVPLRAFYQGKRGEKLLIYDYLHNRSLHDLLHESRAGRPMLNWTWRHKIALGIARGLAYLHTGQENPITHGNVKSKNVLVDDFFVARLTEYGLDKLMVPAVADEMIAVSKQDGYKAPELQKMKKCNSRTDVYAFGIVLLEILMGKKPGKGNEGSDLAALVKVEVLEETTMELFDVELMRGVRNANEEGVVQALKLAMGCCAPMPEVRPDMREVVKQLEENRPRNRSALYTPNDSRSEAATPF